MSISTKQTSRDTTVQVGCSLRQRPENTADGGLFVRLLLVPGLTRQITMGSSRMFRHFGTIVAEIHQRINTGTAASLDVVDTPGASAFRGSTVDGITYQSPENGCFVEDEGQFFEYPSGFRTTQTNRSQDEQRRPHNTTDRRRVNLGTKPGSGFEKIRFTESLNRSTSQLRKLRHDSGRPKHRRRCSNKRHGERRHWSRVQPSPTRHPKRIVGSSGRALQIKPPSRRPF